MDKTELVTSDLQAGREFIEALDKRGIPVDVAAWLQDEDGRWQLLISTPLTDKAGSGSIYQAISSTVRRLDATGIELDDILVASPREHLVKDLTRLVRTGDELQMLRLHDLELGGRLFRSSRIYRVKGGQRPNDGLEYDARVRHKMTGRLGVVRGVFRTSSGPRYLVLYDLTSDDIDPAKQDPPREAGRDLAAQELDFLYAVRPTGSPEKPPLMARPA
jgi:hypothetical protein